jgi:hypothetical protein
MFVTRLLAGLAVVALAACTDSDPVPTGGAPVAGTADLRTPSMARIWNEELLDAIRRDYARPTVHARNLFHISAAMYDAWAVYDDTASTHLLGRQLNDFTCNLGSLPEPDDVHAAREQALSYAAYRLIQQRFATSPLAQQIYIDADDLMVELGYDPDNFSVDYSGGSAAALGNYIAQCYIAYGLQDGSNEANNYANRFYQPVNPPIEVEKPGNPAIVNLDRWQPVHLDLFIDQAGNPISLRPPHLSPEWGQVRPFALAEADRTVYHRDGFDYWVYHDPGPPPSLYGSLADEYKWTFSLVAIWGSHLDSSDGVMIDISPASIGNIQEYPETFAEHRNFYDLFGGGTVSPGYEVNPVTGAPYEPQLVPRGDYARVLAEFWADGPESETPPGHWYVIHNEAVADHPSFVRRMGAAGRILGPLEWDVKAYFALGGAMHDAAVTAWGIKGWYDFIRPISAIRAMADLGQSSDPALPSYHVDGIPLVPGYIELVAPDDPLAGANGEHVGKIKLYTWRGPPFIPDPAVTEAGAGWILAENWWTYQRPTFVTPPFAGYISGHSTFSRAAAEVLTRLHGSEFFPGGLSKFDIERNEFLVFEEGPSVDMTLQWAKFRDASDQCSLSRIYGSIHPPVDDIPGRKIGAIIGNDAFDLAEEYFLGIR